jgi:hypothetical protein
MKDGPALERFARLCGDELGKAHNPALSARFARLLDEARNHDVAPASLPPEIHGLVSGGATDTDYETVESRMRECLDDEDRARCALTMLLQQAESFAGYLYGIKEGGVVLLAGLPERSPEPGLSEWLQQLAAIELTSDGDVIATGEADTCTQDAAPSRYVDGEGRAFEPMWLVAREQPGQRVPVAVLAYHVVPGPRSLPDRGLLAHIAEQLR